MADDVPTILTRIEEIEVQQETLNQELAQEKTNLETAIMEQAALI